MFVSSSTGLYIGLLVLTHCLAFILCMLVLIIVLDCRTENRQFSRVKPAAFIIQECESSESCQKILIKKFIILLQYLLSINNVKLSIANRKTSPPYHPVCSCNTPPENKQLKDQNHARTDIRPGWTHCKHTLVNLEIQYNEKMLYNLVKFCS